MGRTWDYLSPSPGLGFRALDVELLKALTLYVKVCGV